MSGFAYFILSRTIIAADGKDSVLGNAVGRDAKGMLSLVLYTLGIVLAFASPLLAVLLYVVTAVMWFIPDRRIEERMTQTS